MVLAGGERGKLKSKEVVWPQELASQSLSFSICKMNTLLDSRAVPDNLGSSLGLGTNK
jgi:hypothetical protein